ncbi:unnamed protein product [marine sediment metagenome]|uniref:Uncharacterized protein n=1 Tax=marine sediment metagenome TaxID=412755 RepID=X0XAU8_9ZZZZ
MQVDKIKRINRLVWYAHKLCVSAQVNFEQLEAIEWELLELFDYRHPEFEARCIAAVVYEGHTINQAIQAIYDHKKSKNGH